MNATPCPDRRRLANCLLGKLDAQESSAVLSHLELCSSCQESAQTLIDKGDTLVKELKAVPADDPFENESGCQAAVAQVEALGREPSLTCLRQAATAESDGDLGTLREYRLLSKLGQGGMGTVYKALHVRLDKVVALKVLPRERMEDEQAVARFQREMKAVGKLDHPHIVRAMDAGEVDGTHFLVMEYVRGTDLSHLVKKLGPLPIAEACELIRQAAIALQEAHSAGRVHRDIKPSNLMLTDRGVVKILDMGLALLSDAHAPNQGGLTTSGQMMGTLDYMAPEQGGSSHDVDIRADIYALGASLYRLLTGEVIFHGAEFQTPMQKLMALATRPAPPIQQRRPEVPDELAAIVHRMVEKEPQDRYATPAEVAAVLTPFAVGANIKWLMSAAGLEISPRIDTSPSATAPALSHSEVGTSPSLAAKPPVAKPPRRSRSESSSAESAPEIKVALPRPQAVPRQARPKTPVAIAAGFVGAIGLAIALAAMVFYFQTPQGTLRVEISDPAIEVAVLGTDIVLKKDETEQIKLSPGEKTLLVSRGDFNLQTEKFELLKGGTTVVKVELLPGKVQVLDGSRVIGQQNLTAASPDPIAASSTPEANYALEFSSKGSFARVDGFDVGSGPLTAEVNLTVHESMSWNGILTMWNSDQRMILLQVLNNFLSIRISDAEVDRSKTHEQPLDQVRGQPLHVAVTIDGDDFHIYVNGRESLKSSQVRERDPKNTIESPGLYFSKSGNSARVQLDEVRISNSIRYTQDFTPPSAESRFQPDPQTLALYHCDDSQGATLRDSSGHNRHGDILGAKWVRAEALAPMLAEKSPAAADTVSEFALDISAEAAHVVLPLKMQAIIPFTLEMTVTPEKLYDDGVSRRVWHAGGCELKQYNDRWCWGAFPIKEGKVGEKIIVTPEPMVPGKTTHLAVILTAGSMAMFVDGKLIARKQFPGPLPQYDQIMNLGTVAQPDTYGSFTGLIHEVRISKGERYIQDFQPAEHLNADAQTIALYKCNEGQGTTLFDSSGNGHHGQLNGAKWRPIPEDAAVSDPAPAANHVGDRPAAEPVTPDDSAAPPEPTSP